MHFDLLVMFERYDVSGLFTHSTLTIAVAPCVVNIKFDFAGRSASSLFDTPFIHHKKLAHFIFTIAMKMWSDSNNIFFTFASSNKLT